MLLNKILLTFFISLALNSVGQYATRAKESFCEKEELYEGQSSFEVKRFKRKYEVTVKINAVRVGRNNPIKVIRLEHREKLRYESELLQLNDSTAVQLQLARTKHGQEKELHFRLTKLYYNKTCWKPNGIQYFEKVRSSTITYSNMSSGGHGDVPYIELDAVSIEIK